MSEIVKELRAGDRWDLLVTIVDGNGEAYDLTGLTIWFTMKASQSAADVDADLKIVTGDPEVTLEDAAGGVARFTIGKDKTVMKARLYEYDIQIQGAAWPGPITTESGTIKVLPQITISSI